MPKRDNTSIADMQPDELTELKKLVKEFVTRMTNIENEVSLLKEDRKALIEEFGTKLDLRVLNAALKVAKIKSSVDRKDTFDMIMEVFEEEAT